jgi:cytochrome c oxidase subunit 3
MAEPLPCIVPPAERALGLVTAGGPPLPQQGQQPIANGILAMAFFLGTETMLFAGMISAFLVLRAGAASWPPPGQPRLPVGVTALNTMLLLLSGYTVQRAAGASRDRSGTAEVIRWLAATTALGTTFLLVQGVEWVRLIRHGMRVSSGPYGATFYTLVGCHGVHVLAAVVTLVVLLASMRGAEDAERQQRHVEVCRMYWLFVVAVWPVLYVLVYLV